MPLDPAAVTEYWWDEPQLIRPDKFSLVNFSVSTFSSHQQEIISFTHNFLSHYLHQSHRGTTSRDVPERLAALSLAALPDEEEFGLHVKTARFGSE